MFFSKLFGSKSRSLVFFGSLDDYPEKRNGEAVRTASCLAYTSTRSVPTLYLYMYMTHEGFPHVSFSQKIELLAYLVAKGYVKNILNNLDNWKHFIYICKKFNLMDYNKIKLICKTAIIIASIFAIMAVTSVIFMFNRY